MLAGEIYSAVDPQLIEELTEVKEIIHDYNLLRPSEKEKAREILKDLLGHIADDEILIIQPFYCDYGKQISVGKRFFANFNFTVLDEASVTIGDDCFIGPNVSIYTACHSTDPVERNSRREWAEPVTIGDNVWIGGSVTILPGVTIGDNVTIGADYRCWQRCNERYSFEFYCGGQPLQGNKDSMTLRVIGLPLATKGTQKLIDSVDSNQCNQINRNKQDEIRDR